VTLFLALQTQWRIVQGMGGGSFTGLDYAAADAAMRMLDIPRRERPEMFAGLCHMERAALFILNQRRES
jgi:hypothetical protein